MSITFHACAPCAADEVLAIVTSLDGWRESTPLTTCPSIAPAWLGSLQLTSLSPAPSTVEYRYVKLGLHGAVRWEEGPARVLSVSAGALPVEVNDGVVFDAHRSVSLTRLKRAFVDQHQVQLVFTPEPSSLKLSPGVPLAEHGYWLSVTNVAHLERITYVCGSERFFRAWQPRGALVGSSAFGVVQDTRRSHQVSFALERSDGTIIGHAPYLLGHWVKDEQQVVFAFLDHNGGVAAELAMRVMVAWPLRSSHADAVAFLAEGGRTTFDWLSVRGVPVGHRGYGKTSSRLGVAENTLLAFETAQIAGVRWVEFDVQLLRDCTPVVFHDAEVQLGGGNSALRLLSPSQFSALAPAGFRQGRNRRSGSDPKVDSVPGKKVQTIEAPYPTLKELFECVDPVVGFNVEIKYAEREEEECLFINRNDYVDRVLECVGQHAGMRQLYFSSFDPDVCQILASKQRRYPVFFLSEAGTALYTDFRRNTIASAVAWARMSDLDGVVLDVAGLLKLGPDAAAATIQGMHQERLCCLTYGTENNNAATFRLLKEWGVNGIIIDHVRALAEFIY